MGDLVYDPNHPDLLHRAWVDAVGIGDIAANGWVLLNSERNVLDMLVTDTEDGWVYGDPPSMSDRTGWDVLADHAKSIGATDVIYVHHHSSVESGGLCRDATEFVTSGAIALNDLGLQMRAAFICNATELEGVLQLEKQSRSNLDNPIAEGLRLRKQFAERDDIDPEDRATILAAIDNTVNSLAGAEEPDMDLIMRASKIAQRRMLGNLGFTPDSKPTPEPKRDPFSLPSINVADIKYMN